MSRLRITVVGAGLAGLACALAVATAGAQVRVVEPARSLVPAACVELVPSLLRDLVSLGVGDASVRAGFPFRRTGLLDLQGRELGWADAVPLAGARYPATAGIAWPELRRILRAAAQDAGVEFLQGLHADGALPSGRVECADGTVLDADLVVLACGAHSPLRACLSGAIRPAIAERSMGLFLTPRLGLDDAVIGIARDGRKAHVIPVSATHAGVRVQAVAGSDHTAADLLAGFSGPLQRMAAQVARDTPVWVRPDASYLAPGHWHCGALLAVGDCAYSLPSHFGQAAAQPVEDAVVLGDLIARATAPGDVPTAFTQRRRPRVTRVLHLLDQAVRWDAGPEATTNWPELARQVAQTIHQPA